MSFLQVNWITPKIAPSRRRMIIMKVLRNEKWCKNQFDRITSCRVMASQMLRSQKKIMALSWFVDGDLRRAISQQPYNQTKRCNVKILHISSAFHLCNSVSLAAITSPQWMFSPTESFKTDVIFQPAILQKLLLLSTNVITSAIFLVCCNPFHWPHSDIE